MFRSVTHIYAQVIDDLSGKTLVSASSVEPAVKGAFAKDVRGGNLKGAEAIGKVDRGAVDRKRHQARRVRPQRVSVSRAHSRRGRCGAQSRSGVLDAAPALVNESIASQLDIKDTVVSINRVTKVVKGGKNLSFSALVVVGDGHGVVGFGIGKAKEVPSAIKKGIEAAKKNLIRVPLQGTTIPHPITGVFGAGQRAAEAGARRHRHHRRRRGSRGRRSGGHHQHPDEVARIGQPAQRRAGDVRGFRVAEGSGRSSRGCAARTLRTIVESAGSVQDCMANHRTDTKGDTVKVTLIKSPTGFNRNQGTVVRSLGLRRIRHTVELKDTPAVARHDSQGATPR